MLENVAEHKNRFITIAKISGVYGIKGQLKIHSFTEPRSAFLSYKKLYWNHNGSWELMPVIKNSAREQGNGLILSIEDCADRDCAKKYHAAEIAVTRDALPVLADQQYYWTDLEGLEVYTVYPDGQNSQDNGLTDKGYRYLGIVSSLMETGSNDVVIVHNSKVNKTHLVPYLLDTYVLSIDLATNTMLVDWDPEF